MVIAKEPALRADSSTLLSARYRQVRSDSTRLCATLAPEDFVVQSMPDVSPTKWHLAHVTWFFEKFVLEPFAKHYAPFDETYHFLFNSYYVSAGEMHRRPHRGLLSRPTVQQVFDYREHVDEQVVKLIDERGDEADISARITLGLNHERQHQELLLTDIKHVFAQNPIMPAVNAELETPPTRDPSPLEFLAGAAGIHEIGAADSGDDRFCFDNETPRHRVLLDEHRIGSRLITNGEYREFVRDGGYANPLLWLSDGWATVCERGWARPLYWSEDCEHEFTLGGQRPLDLTAPVAHVSYYEADAFARWAGARLPTEAEWECTARDHALAGNLLESQYWQPVAAAAAEAQWFGDVWEWTTSSYGPYPGFKPLDGSLGEYNGKFMCNQMTVRGGSCVSAADHLRASYRSFFYPDARWQFLGIRLGKDGVR